MKSREAFFAMVAIGIALSGLAGMLANGYGAEALHAEAAGFDAFAYLVFGERACDRHGAQQERAP